MNTLELEIDDRNIGPTVKERVIRDAHKLLKDRLLDAGYSGHWVLRPIQQITSRADVKVAVSRVYGQAVRLKIKPYGNDSCWEYDLVPPMQYEPSDIGHAIIDQKPAKPSTVEPKAKPTAVPKTPAPTVSDPLSVMKSLSEKLNSLGQVTVRRQERRSKLAAAETAIAELRAQIAEAEGKIQGLEQEAMSLMEEDSTDADADTAEQFIATLAKLVQS